MRTPAVFLDRDGVINQDTGYVHTIDDFEFLPGVLEGCLKLQSAGFKLVVVTNQSGIARGYYTEQQFQTLNAYMVECFLTAKVYITAVYHCPHHPSGQNPQLAIDCDCRKPKPKMLLDAASAHAIDLDRSYIVGDRTSDLKAGMNAGLKRNVLVSTGKELTSDGTELADYVAADFSDVCGYILND
ncbi:D-glycero-beta-D-manno-heptose 1,7-bisphosphate 7-phosphatase [Echinimonas agarilytica]|uniref:D,D-heptose 1,7-bisphosphate phosphatase n=1 Tax=Echinimonas agarilytica TaxID=1215918 RepID=A0AA41W7V6_9GAMM|nr:D-glycero-beta-D-manno-heptose 1,7-bisphosphate 7-phosphatase [Echinimonas agarilytica]MCM2680013.1 D-glycero-beta-D-manno-heptose 1,7-bisphosphate 7-phosphatase [Echinimonas agarilytica]